MVTKQIKINKKDADKLNTLWKKWIEHHPDMAKIKPNHRLMYEEMARYFIESD